MEAAQAAQRQGEYGKATTLLERAIKKDPYNGWLWYELAGLQYAMGNYAQARELCKKSLSLGGNDSSLRQATTVLMQRADGHAQ